jgi:hypothetical protein
VYYFSGANTHAVCLSGDGLAVVFPLVSTSLAAVERRHGFIGRSDLELMESGLRLATLRAAALHARRLGALLEHVHVVDLVAVLALQILNLDGHLVVDVLNVRTRLAEEAHRAGVLHHEHIAAPRAEEDHPEAAALRF